MKRLLAFLILFPGLAWAQAPGFHPDDNCVKVLSKTDNYTATMVAAWVYGYIAGANDDFAPVDIDNNNVLLGNVVNACKSRPQLSLRQLVAMHKKAGADTPGSLAHAKVLLDKFVTPGADLATLTWSLRPSEAEIRAVYAEPLGSRLVAMYGQMFQPGVKLEPKAHQTDLWVSRATVLQLKRGDAVLRDFPGGYKDVLPYMQGDYPIVQFKFVRPGETTGFAFDGLIFINGHWVLMPKPWRGLR